MPLYPSAVIPTPNAFVRIIESRRAQLHHSMVQHTHAIAPRRHRQTTTPGQRNQEAVVSTPSHYDDTVRPPLLQVQAPTLVGRAKYPRCRRIHAIAPRRHRQTTAPDPSINSRRSRRGAKKAAVSTCRHLTTTRRMR